MIGETRSQQNTNISSFLWHQHLIEQKTNTHTQRINFHSPPVFLETNQTKPTKQTNDMRSVDFKPNQNHYLLPVVQLPSNHLKTCAHQNSHRVTLIRFNSLGANVTNLAKKCVSNCVVLLMAEILHQSIGNLSMLFIMYRVLYIQTVVGNGISSIH